MCLDLSDYADDRLEIEIFRDETRRDQLESFGACMKRQELGQQALA
jgi:hypothetical protein